MIKLNLFIVIFCIAFAIIDFSIAYSSTNKYTTIIGFASGCFLLVPVVINLLVIKKKLDIDRK